MMDEGWELGGAAHHGASFLDLPHDPVSHEPEAAGWDYSMYSDAAATARLYPSVSVPAAASPSPALVMEHSFQPSSRAMTRPSSTTTTAPTSAATPATVAAATPTARRSQTTRRAGRRKNSAATSVASSSASPTPSSASSATTATKAGAPARRGRKRARAAGAPKSARRLTHNQSEQRRVKRINEQVEQLRALLKRANLSTRSDKCSVLSSAVQYVKSLEERLAASTERAERFEKALLNARLEAAAPALEPLPAHHMALGHGGAAGAGVGATMTTHGHSMTHHIQHQQQMVLSQNHHHHHHAAPSPRLPLGPAPRGAGPEAAAPLSFDYRTVFQYSSIAQAIATTEGDLVDANRLFCELAGLKTRQEVLQYSMFGLTHPSELPVLYGVIGQLLSNTSVNTLQFKKKCVLPIGVLDVVVRMSVVRDTTGKAKCFHCCILPNLDTVLPLADAKACSLPNAAASGYVAPTPQSPAASIASRSTTPATAAAGPGPGPARASPAVMAATAGAVAPAPPLSMPTADIPGHELRVPLAGAAASQTYRQTGALASAMAQPPAAAAHPFHAAGQDVVMLANPTHTANVANGANDPALPPTDAEVSQLLGAAAAAIVSPATSTATPSETEVGDADMDEVSSLLSDESPTASSTTAKKAAAAAAANPACTDMSGTTTTAATAASFGGVKAA